MEPILRLVHGLSLPHFTHFTVRYSDLSSFPYSSCQTRQEASDGGTLLLPLCFGPFYVGLISGYVVQLYYHNISACQHLNAKFLTVGFEPTFPSKLRIVSYPTPLRDFFPLSLQVACGSKHLPLRWVSHNKQSKPLIVPFSVTPHGGDGLGG